jgi:PAS domain S-box-containing protein
MESVANHLNEANSSFALSCADEPIHIPGAIQQHGFFLLTDADVEHVVAASGNVEDFLGVPLKLILGAQLDALLDRELLASVAAALEGVQPQGSVTYLGSFRIGDELFSVMTHRIGDRRALEFERVDRLVGPELMNAVITNFVATLGRLPSKQYLCDAVTEQFQALTEYDRVLLYYFDEDGHGVVLSEANNGRLPVCLDLRFPATDIPAQARSLYVQNTVRIIPDANYKPSPLIGLRNQSAAGLNLSMSVLRSVSPVHLEYMRNMGTLSSMSVSIIADGKLWGLISGHHAEPKTVPFLIRSACDMLAKLTSTQLMSLRSAERLEQTVRFHAVQRQLLTRLAVEPNYLSGLRGQMDELLSVANATGVVMLVEGQVERCGKVPDDADLQRIGDWLDNTSDNDCFQTHELARELPWAESIRESASGLLAVRISSVRQRYLLWFRPEIVETVRWAGQPAKPDEAKSLQPRTSFESWKEIVRGRSEPWTEIEIESALDFRAALTFIGLRRAEEAVELGEARFQQLTATLPAKIFTADDEGRLTYVNERWHSQGLSTEGRWFEDQALLPEDVDRCSALWKEAVANNSTFEAEVRLRETSKGPDRWNFVRAIPFRREGAARAGWIGTFIDLTDAKERELALRMNEKLALTGRMTSVIAHEINNPLESITNLLYLLRSELRDEGPASSYITMAESELHRISGITKQTLRWNRESPEVEEVFAASVAIDDVLRLFAGKIRNRGIEVSVKGDREVKLSGSLGKIRQVLANLVSNAIDAAPVGGHIGIQVLSTETHRGFSISDNGEGISETAMTRLFEPFYSTKGDLGNGLGLYISKEIIDRHGGTIEVITEVGKGTSMTVLLPSKAVAQA